MQPGSLDRRTFLRVASLAALGVAVGCSPDEPNAGPTSSPTATATTSPTTPARPLAWRQLSAAGGPKARDHHSFTANADGSILFLFGGKTKGRVFNDAWAYERSTRLWQPLPTGPSARFGHSAAFVDGHLVIFGGQNGGTFYNDTWAFDPVHGRWQKLSPGGRPPAARYGASGTTVANSMVISHGFASGRFNDTWALTRRWANVSPVAGQRPINRCLHRAVYLPGPTKMVLFGGQTNATPFVGDTWTYDPTVKKWAEIKGAGPSPRTLYAAAGTSDRLYIVGGLGPGGPLNDTWSFDGARWRKEAPRGTPPRRRGAMEGAVAKGPALLLFGGTTGPGNLADLWELSIP